MTANDMTRRALLLGSMGAAVGAAVGVANAKPSAEDDKFLDDLGKRSFQYFWEYTDPDSGPHPRPLPRRWFPL